MCYSSWGHTESDMTEELTDRDLLCKSSSKSSSFYVIQEEASQAVFGWLIQGTDHSGTFIKPRDLLIHPLPRISLHLTFQ